MTHSVGTLIKQALYGEDAALRREAIIALGYEKSEAIFPLLIEQLGDDNPSIQHAAIISLGRYGNTEAIDELVKPKILHSPVVNIRWAAVAAIGKLGDFRVIEHLLKVVDDSEWIVRNQAATELKVKIHEIISLCESRYARILVRLLALPQDEIVNLAIEGFVELAETSVGILLDAIASGSPVVREHATKALGLIGSKEAVLPLIDLLHDFEWTVRCHAAEALGLIHDKRAIEPLVISLRDNVEKVQQEAIRALVGFERLATRPLLNALSYEKNKFNLRAIILTLGQIGDMKAVPALIGHLRNSYFVVRRAAIKALRGYGPKIIDALVPTLSYNKSDIKPLLDDALNCDDQPLQLRAIKALGGLEDHRAVELLKKLVDEGVPDVQDAAIAALVQIGCAAWGRCGALMILSHIGNKSLVSVIIPSLSDDSANVRLEAVRALARLGGFDVIDPLIKAARKDRDSYIRFEAVRRLRVVGVGYDQVLQLAFSALKDPHRDVRSQAARLLGNFQDGRSIAPLIKTLHDKHWTVRESAEYALFNFGDQAVEPLIAAIESKSWRTQFRVARLLGEIGGQRAVDPLEQLLKKRGVKSKVKEIVQQSLIKLCGKAAA